jgi:GNAT superfamily N-acetyltransferase
MKIVANSFDCCSAYRAQLDALMADTFGFTFAGWDGPLGWSADYISYGVMQDGQLLAHTGVYRMELLAGGARRTAYQIGGVATRPEQRGQGLSRMLIEHILGLHPGAVFFLFADDSVRGFYPKFGFTPLEERQPTLEIAPSSPLAVAQPAGPLPAGVRRLALDDPALPDYLRKPAAVSAILDCASAAPLHWFHLRLGGADRLYEIPALRALLAARQEESLLTIDGLWAAAPLTFADLAPYLAFPGVRRIHFGFNPDGLGAPYTMTVLPEPSGLQVRGELGVRAAFIFPVLART